MSLHPFHSDRLIMNPAGLAGVLTVMHLCMDMKNTLLGKYHYMLFYVTAAMNPRMLMTVSGVGLTFLLRLVGGVGCVVVFLPSFIGTPSVRPDSLS